jgi:hypothetical protein
MLKEQSAVSGADSNDKEFFTPKQEPKAKIRNILSTNHPPSLQGGLQYTDSTHPNATSFQKMR